jgi:hypothetical protein
MQYLPGFATFSLDNAHEKKRNGLQGWKCLYSKPGWCMDVVTARLTGTPKRHHFS